MNIRFPLKPRPGRGISPWLILAAVLVLIPLYVLITLDSIRKQEEGTRELLVTRGETLIRALDAGLRTAAGFHWDDFQIQKLIMEMARPDDLTHIIVVDRQGRIVADSDPAMIGESYGLELDLLAVIRQDAARGRIVSREEEGDTFEVYRGFSPVAGILPGGENLFRRELAIFVGLDPEPLKLARKKESEQTVVMAAVLFFVSLLALLILFLAQANRFTRTALGAAQALSTGVISYMPLGVIAADGKGRLLTVNAAMEEILGVKLSPFLGRELLPHLPSYLAHLGAITGGQKKTLTEQPLERPEGTKYVDVLVAPMKDAGPEPPGWVMLIRDVTELRQLRRQVTHQERLVMLGNLAAGLAHEIRNPLSSLKGFATYFRERLAENGEDRQNAEIMVAEVDRLNRVITRLLDLTRPVEPERTNFDFLALTRETAAILAPLAQKGGVAIRVFSPREILPFRGDADQLKQALLNLFLNALEAMPEGGVITVKLDNPEGWSVRLIVEDTGKGIAAADLAHIFDPYFTTKAGGTGLGLAVVQKILVAHGGEIQVTSEPGKGSRFVVFLGPQKENHD